MALTSRTLTAALWLSACAGIAHGNPVSTDFSAHSASGTFNNDGGYFGFSQYDVTVSVKAVVDALPTEHLHYRLHLVEVDTGSNDDLGDKLICVGPGAWTQRADGKYETLLSYTFPKVSTYYGDDWTVSAANEDPFCGAISTTWDQLTALDPLRQAIMIDVGDFPITSVSYGRFSQQFDQPLQPGTQHVQFFEPQFGSQPYTLTFIGHPDAHGLLNGLVSEPLGWTLVVAALPMLAAGRRRAVRAG